MGRIVTVRVLRDHLGTDLPNEPDYTAGEKVGLPLGLARRRERAGLVEIIDDSSPEPGPDENQARHPVTEVKGDAQPVDVETEENNGETLREDLPRRDPTAEEFQESPPYYCQGTKASGERCGREVENEGDYCWQHQPEDLPAE